MDLKKKNIYMICVDKNVSNQTIGFQLFLYHWAQQVTIFRMREGLSKVYDYI